MKKLTISITDDAHDRLLEIQLDRKKSKLSKTSLAEIAGEILSEFLENEGGASKTEKGSQ